MLATITASNPIVQTTLWATKVTSGELIRALLTHTLDTVAKSLSFYFSIFPVRNDSESALMFSFLPFPHEKRILLFKIQI